MARSKRIRRSLAAMQAECTRFNAGHAIGDTIRCWSGLREGDPKPRTIIAPGAYVLSGHTAVVQVAGGGGCICLTHVEGWPPK